nr:hypothetical protein [Tanacetum cinerariifolium]
EAQFQALIDQGVAAAIAEAKASRVRNGYGSNGSGLRLAQAVRVALTWWNSYVKTVTLEVAHALPWKTLKKMMTDKYCPRGEIKKLETKMVEKYIGGVPDTIHDSVKATKPKTMQEAIEFATELIDKRIRDAVENKRKFEGTSGNNQNQPQQNKRHNTGRAYAAGNSDRNIYTGPKPLCSKCDYHHEEVAHSRDCCTQIMDYCQSREVHTSTLVTQIEALQRDVSTLQRQHIDDEDRLTRHIQHEYAQRDVAPEDGDSCS